jgi:hypothetical protein
LISWSASDWHAVFPCPLHSEIDNSRQYENMARLALSRGVAPFVPKVLFSLCWCVLLLWTSCFCDRPVFREWCPPLSCNTAAMSVKHFALPTTICASLGERIPETANALQWESTENLVGLMSFLSGVISSSTALRRTSPR